MEQRKPSRAEARSAILLPEVSSISFVSVSFHCGAPPASRVSSVRSAGEQSHDVTTGDWEEPPRLKTSAFGWQS